MLLIAAMKPTKGKVFNAILHSLRFYIGVNTMSVNQTPIPNGLGVMINENMIRKGFFSNGKLNGYGRI